MTSPARPLTAARCRARSTSYHRTAWTSRNTRAIQGTGTTTNKVLSLTRWVRVWPVLDADAYVSRTYHGLKRSLTMALGSGLRKD